MLGEHVLVGGKRSYVTDVLNMAPTTTSLWSGFKTEHFFVFFRRFVLSELRTHFRSFKRKVIPIDGDYYVGSAD